VSKAGDGGAIFCYAESSMYPISNVRCFLRLQNCKVGKVDLLLNRLYVGDSYEDCGQSRRVRTPLLVAVCKENESGFDVL
jgi:hypothetical protein